MGDGFMEWSKVRLPAEEDVCRVLDLHERPVVVAELSDDGAEAPGEPVEGAMRRTNRRLAGELLGGFEVVQLNEGAVEQSIADAGLVELTG